MVAIDGVSDVHVIVVGIAHDGGRVSGGTHELCEREIIAEQLVDGAAGVRDALGELRARQHVLELGDQRSAGEERQRPAPRGIENRPRTAAPQKRRSQHRPPRAPANTRANQPNHNSDACGGALIGLFVQLLVVVHVINLDNACAVKSTMGTTRA